MLCMLLIQVCVLVSTKSSPPPLITFIQIARFLYFTRKYKRIKPCSFNISKAKFFYIFHFLSCQRSEPTKQPSTTKRPNRWRTHISHFHYSIQSIRFTRSRIFLSDTARRWRDGIGSGSVNPSKHGELNCFLTIIHFHFQFCYFVIFSIHYNLSISTICNVHSSPTKWKWFAVDGLQ